MVELDRILFIDRKIRYNGRVTTEQVQEEFGVSMRTVRSDISHMKDMMNIPIGYSREKGGYVYTTPYEFFIYSDEKLVLTYTFLKGIIHTMNYVPLISERMEQTFQMYIPGQYRGLTDKIEYELSQFEMIQPEKLMFVCESFMTEKKLCIEYTNQKGELKEFTVEPLKLMNYQGNWYLIAHLTYLDTLSVFNFSRIGTIGLSEEIYENKIKPEVLKQTLANNFGIFKGASPTGQSEFVTFRFYNVARTITKNQIFHPKQEVTEGHDPVRGDYVEFKLSVKHYDEILGRVLQFGIDGEVISPPEFREKWLGKIRDLAAMYL